ncbi:hypothetical protein IV73_GL000265 [Weissella kandleri]|uniref:Mevalonate kinase n=1 Tax=Weissella kandleri TaxID=1616 RepID=A0A0R2JIQ5_9LACO|nr:mevalonate kinase [Weissella kandleri]KRN75766.1 hypothetical protein IV73_GL000265 [Weissella kandleri]
MVVKILKKTSIGKSHAKVILMGEHSVVYGQPAIALPLPDISFTTTIMPRLAGQMIFTPTYQGPLSSLAENYEGIRQLILRLLDFFNAKKRPFTLHINSDIPQERGMGSSAASAISIVRAFYDFFDTPLSSEHLQTWAAVEERITHGSPSGLDTSTVASSLPIWFIKNELTQPFELNLNATFILADTGIHGQTGLAVSVVRSLLEEQPHTTKKSIQHLGELTTAAHHALQFNTLSELGSLMNQAQAELQTLGVSHPQLDTLIHAARQAGALGAKLTGGGIGGTMLALAPDQKAADGIIEALENAGATEIWTQTYPTN